MTVFFSSFLSNLYNFESRFQKFLSNFLAACVVFYVASTLSADSVFPGHPIEKVYYNKLQICSISVWRRWQNGASCSVAEVTDDLTKVITI